MSGDFSGMDFIVLAVLLFLTAFLAAWLISPALRTGIERPKYRFLAAVETHDRELKGDAN
ncbi:MAG: hypothetical protein M3N93_08345 [Acidobacteriota bacterium]|nr:hypothetical protein [Acidobacteriota bacterium]